MNAQSLVSGIISIHVTCNRHRTPLMLRDLANGHTDLPAPNVFEHVRCLTCLASHDAAMDILMKEHPG